MEVYTAKQAAGTSMLLKDMNKDMSLMQEILLSLISLRYCSYAAHEIAMTTTAPTHFYY